TLVHQGIRFFHPRVGGEPPELVRFVRIGFVEGVAKTGGNGAHLVCFTPIPVGRHPLELGKQVEVSECHFRLLLRHGTYPVDVHLHLMGEDARLLGGSVEHQCPLVSVNESSDHHEKGEEEERQEDVEFCAEREV